MLARSFKDFYIDDLALFRSKLLQFAAHHSNALVLSNQGYDSKYGSLELVAGWGTMASLTLNAGTAFDQLQAFHEQHQDWLLGHFTYDLKQETGGQSLTRPDRMKFSDLHFFVPETLVLLKYGSKQVSVHSYQGKEDHIIEDILQHRISISASTPPIAVQSTLSKEAYINTILKLKEHIARGDCYEINYCMEFFADQATIDPVSTYEQLTRFSPNPFSAFYRNDNRFMLCASPERYLRKRGIELISQPIKGTIQRQPHDAAADELNRQQLYHSSKDRAENVMVVDMVRNDLSKVCERGSVQVEELYGIYAFPQVFQMISTVSGKMKQDLPFTESLKASFPMGSMTGAPKKIVMDLIDRYELSGRGLFSGSVGYITPEADFDFNVIIRSIFYDQTNRILSYKVGSGITFYSDPEKEYEECLLKAQAIEKVLGLRG